MWMISAINSTVQSDLRYTLLAATVSRTAALSICPYPSILHGNWTSCHQQTDIFPTAFQYAILLHRMAVDCAWCLCTMLLTADYTQNPCCSQINCEVFVEASHWFVSDSWLSRLLHDATS